MTRWSGNRSVTVYFDVPAVVDTRETYLELQFGAGTPLPEVAATKVRFTFAAWDSGGAAGGSTPKPESTILNPGTPSLTTDNPMSIQRIFPSFWYF